MKKGNLFARFSVLAGVADLLDRERRGLGDLIDVRLGQIRLAGYSYLAEVGKLDSKAVGKKLVGLARELSEGRERGYELGEGDSELVGADLLELLENFKEKILSAVPEELDDGSRGLAVAWLRGQYLEVSGDRGWFGEGRVGELRKKLVEYFRLKQWMSGGARDLMRIGSIEELWGVVEQAIEAREYAEKFKFNGQEYRKKALEGSRRLGEDGNWVVWQPTTMAAACELGKGSNWCTSARSEDNRFDQYSLEGPLYIFVSKRDPGEKYQFSYETDSFMDQQDQPIRDGRLKAELVWLASTNPQNNRSLPSWPNHKSYQFSTGAATNASTGSPAAFLAS